MPTENGRQEGTCLEDFKLGIREEFKSPAQFAKIAGVISALAFTLQYLLWKDFKDLPEDTE